MIDHLMKFDDELHARAAVGPLGYGAIDAESGHWFWDASVLPGQTVTLVDAVVDEEGNTVTPAANAPGYWLTISTKTLQSALTGMADRHCRVAVDREKSEGQPFVVYAAPDLDQAQFASAKVSPVWAGSPYVFGETA